MSLPNGTNEYIQSDCINIHKAASAIKNADRIVVGIGAGLTTAGGLNYADPALAQKWYPEYYAMGKRSIIEIMSGFWPTSINETNAVAFWGFWARHIYHIRYEANSLQPYRELLRIINNKDYFICTTNVDGQLEKSGLEKNKIFAPQGDYALLQCEKPCTKDVYPNKQLVKTMIENMVSEFEIRQYDIPRCPHCGRFLIPNLRCDYSFVEEPHLANKGMYEAFLHESQKKKLVLLELGVGFNTPGIIRYPFERITDLFEQSTLIRINDSVANAPNEIKNKSICIQGDLAVVLNHI